MLRFHVCFSVARSQLPQEGDKHEIIERNAAPAGLPGARHFIGREDVIVPDITELLAGRILCRPAQISNLGIDWGPFLAVTDCSAEDVLLQIDRVHQRERNGARMEEQIHLIAAQSSSTGTDASSANRDKK